MKRLFVAVSIIPSDELRKKCIWLQQQLSREKISWVDAVNIHITLRFFGETPEEKIPKINVALSKATQGINGLELVVKGCGIFGSRHSPGVIWLGIMENEYFRHLYEKVTRELTKIGYAPDRQNFVPHITMGRVKKKLVDLQKFQEVIGRLRDMYFQTSEVNELILFESILRKLGPEYHIVSSFSLAGK